MTTEERAVEMTEGPQGTEELETDYLAYLLRLWRMRGEGAAGWRASLARPGSDERHGFANLDDLFLFLRRQTGAGSGGDDDKDGPK
jgi:hypothetical protein